MTFQVFCRKLKGFTLQKACRRLKDGLWSTGSILLLVRPAGLPEPEVPPCAGELRRATEKDLPDCAAFEDAARYVPVYKSMLERGDLVLFGYLDGTCVFRCCLQRSGSFAYRNHTVRELGPSEAYVHYVFCAPAARRKGFHKAALLNLRAAFPDRTFYAGVREDNIPSLRAFFHTGYRPYSRVTVKNRFFRSALAETLLTDGEAAAILENASKAGERRATSSR